MDADEMGAKMLEAMKKDSQSESAASSDRPKYELPPELLEKIFGENPASGDELDALFEELGLGPEGVLYADDGYGEAFFDDEHPDQHKSTVKLVEPELGDVEEGLYERFGEGEDEL